MQSSMVKATSSVHVGHCNYHRGISHVHVYNTAFACNMPQSIGAWSCGISSTIQTVFPIFLLLTRFPLRVLSVPVLWVDELCARGKNIRTDMSLSLLAVIHALVVAVPVATARK